MDNLYRKGLYLEYMTVGYNILEAIASLVFGIVADSIALVGFGLDSIVESLSGCILIWRLRQHGKVSHKQEALLERRAQRFIAVTFFLLAAYVLFESVRKLYYKEIPDPSLPGMVVACVSLVVMPLLTWQKYAVGKAIKSKALIADSKETLACAFLSGALFFGLGTHYFFHFWQADAMVGIIIVIFLVREGFENWSESAEADEQESV